MLTLGTLDLADEGPVTGVTITCETTLTFGDNSSSPDTLTRSSGSWLADGFRVGDSFTITGTASNNVTATITVLTATVLTVVTGTFAAEVIGAEDVTIVAGETESQWVSTMDSAFATVDGQKRIDIGLGRAAKVSPITGYKMRRPAQWPASIREYQHDVHIPCWRKEHGPLLDWDLYDDDGNLTEFDEASTGGALAARFTCLRTYANGPAGVYVALSLTRATESSLLSRTHNMAVANIAQTVCQAEGENAIGVDLVLNADGTAESSSLRKVEDKINAALQTNLLVSKQNEGPRASSAKFTASTDDILNVVPATMTGTCALGLKGTIEQVDIVIRVK